MFDLKCMSDLQQETIAFVETKKNKTDFPVIFTFRCLLLVFFRRKYAFSFASKVCDHFTYCVDMDNTNLYKCDDVLVLLTKPELN